MKSIIIAAIFILSQLLILSTIYMTSEEPEIPKAVETPKIVYPAHPKIAGYKVTAWNGRTWFEEKYPRFMVSQSNYIRLEDGTYITEGWIMEPVLEATE